MCAGTRPASPVPHTAARCRRSRVHARSPMLSLLGSSLALPDAVPIMGAPSQIYGVPAVYGGIEDYSSKFLAWKRSFAYIYRSAEHESKAFAAFAQNDDKIRQHNNAKKFSFTLGHNEFSDMTADEFFATKRTVPRARLAIAPRRHHHSPRPHGLTCAPHRARQSATRATTRRATRTRGRRTRRARTRPSPPPSIGFRPALLRLSRTRVRLRLRLPPCLRRLPPCLRLSRTCACASTAAPAPPPPPAAPAPAPAPAPPAALTSSAAGGGTGQCGGCWAFSATGALEGAYFKSQGTLKSFSEEDLIQCSAPHGG